MQDSVSQRIVDTVLRDLKDRAGFDAWWSTIDAERQGDIKASLRVKVLEALDGGAE